MFEFDTLTPSNPREYDDRMCKAVNTFLNKTLANPASKGSRHDTTLQAVWALVNFAQEGHRGALDAISQLKPRFIAEVAPDRQGKEREAAREWASILSGAMEKVNGIQSHTDPCGQSKIERMPPGEFDELTQNAAASQMEESHPEAVQNTGTMPVQAGSTPVASVQNGSMESYEASKNASSSWQFEDLTQLASGIELPPTPTVFQREDGQGLFYRGAVNDLHGEPGCGKSMIAQIATAQELKADRDVIYIDYEDSARNVVKRLLLLGVSGEQIIGHLHYVRPSAKPSSPTSLGGCAKPSTTPIPPRSPSSTASPAASPTRASTATAATTSQPGTTPCPDSSRHAGQRSCSSTTSSSPKTTGDATRAAACRNSPSSTASATAWT